MRRSVADHLKRFAEFWWGDRGFSALLLVILMLFFLSPFLRLFPGRVLFSIFFILLLLTGIASATERKLPRIFAWAVAGTALVFNILHQIIPGKTITGLWYVSAVTFLSLLIGVLIKRVFREGPVTGHRIRGAIAAYLLIGITWTLLYELIALFISGAFSFPPSMTAQAGEPGNESTMIYFSFVTMATLGYGDIVPVHPVARMLAIIEALVGLLYPAILLARLVSLEIIYRNEHGGKRTKDDSVKHREP